mmetsp:Transcript_58790/g.149198  ORF Transcript_58790/g.149198 Transcript_58790/m.149198 type:complete len:218 (-) Transcript_58790:323-976(-)
MYHELPVLAVGEHVVDVVEAREVSPARLDQHIHAISLGLLHQSNAPHLRDGAISRENRVLPGRIRLQVLQPVQGPEFFVGHDRDDVVQLPEEAILPSGQLIYRRHVLGAMGQRHIRAEVVHGLGQHPLEPILVHASGLARTIHTSDQHDPGLVGRGPRRGRLLRPAPATVLQHAAEQPLKGLAAGAARQQRHQRVGAGLRARPILVRQVRRCCICLP